MIDAELDADVVRQAEVEPPGCHAHHTEQGADAQNPEDVCRHARQNGAARRPAVRPRRQPLRPPKVP